MYARRIRRTFALLAVATGALAGCADSVSFPEELAGTFELTTANGHALPYTLPDTGANTTAVLESGSLVILSNGRFNETLNYRLATLEFPAGKPTSAQTIGDATVSGDQITFKVRFENGYSGTITASTVSYAKQSGTNSLALTWVR